MSLFLVIVLTFILIYSYFFLGKRISSPSITVCFSFLCSSFFVLLYEDYWQLEMSVVATVIILGAVVIFFAGNLCMVKFSKYVWNIAEFSVEKFVFCFPGWLLCVYFMVGIIVLYNYYNILFYFINTVNLDITKQFLQVREQSLEGMFTFSPILSVGLSLINCSAFISVYCLLHNVMVRGWLKEDFRFCIPIMMSLCVTTIKMARIDMLQLFLYSITVYSLLLQFYYKSSAVKKFIKYLIIVGAIFLCLFGVLRFLRGGEYDFILHIAKYFGGGLLCFSLYIDHMETPFYPNSYFGIHTFSAIYNTLRSIGFSIPLNFPMDGMSKHGFDFDCNVYSALAPYYEDFGVMGCITIFFLLSCFYSLYHEFIVRNVKCGFWLIVYADLSTTLFLLPISEIFFSAQIAASRIAHFMLSFIIYRILCKNIKMT